jgi:UDP-N-acetylmuramyl pentapeptide phosphotransferase/UDP-N-acetylglucosamine-1-phosphate transferase
MIHPLAIGFWQGFHMAFDSGLPSMGGVGFFLGFCLWCLIVLGAVGMIAETAYMIWHFTFRRNR